MDKQEKKAVSMRMLLQKEGRDISGTVYEDGPVLDWILPENAALSAEPAKAVRDNYHKIQLFQKMIHDSRNTKAYRDIAEKLKRLNRDLTVDVDSRREKKIHFRREKKQMDQMFSEQAAQEIFGVPDAGFCPYVVRSRDILSAFDLTELEFPTSEPDASGVSGQTRPGVQTGDLWSRPWFTADLNSLKNTVSRGTTPGMEGGSCLLGNNEMQFLLTIDDDREYLFDFNTMRQVEDEYSLTDTETSSQLSDFVRANKDRIIKGTVKCHKDAITIDEYEEFTFLFSLARMLRARLVVTIPDMSYEKTFLQLFGDLKEDIFEPFYEEFMQKVFAVSDLNLRWIDRFAKKYGNTDYVVLHKRAEEIHDCFARNRDHYMRKDVIGKITGRDGREAAIRDYICMPAMPYYLWGLEELIEVNRLEEYPSVEKCRRVHRGRIHLNSLLYPQKVCANGRTSGFYADRGSKKYVYE